MDIASIDVLCCRITIGDPDPANPIKIIGNAFVFTEVQEIHINDTYKKLIGTAKVKFPKGTVCRSTVLGNGTVEGVDVSLMTSEVMEHGLVVEKRPGEEVANGNILKVGQRINIKLGYNGALKNMFDGYIVGYNADSIIELSCENMAYVLKLIQTPYIDTGSEGTTVNEVLTGKYNLLKGTGFTVHGDTKKFEIKVGQIKTTDNFTVADILSSWSKYKVYCFLKYDEDSPDSMPAIAVGRPYSSSKRQPVFDGDDTSKPVIIKFDRNVAKNELKVVKTDPQFLVVRGTALGKDQKFFTVAVRLNPEYDPAKEGSKEFQTVNATQISRKTHKITGNVTAEGAKTRTKADLSTYTVVPYMSPNFDIDSDILVEECIEYFRQYNLNGITGSVTIFGDFGLTTAMQVELFNKRNSAMNGVYITEEVTTTFGVNGYRQKITIPYKIKGETATYK